MPGERQRDQGKRGQQKKKWVKNLALKDCVQDSFSHHEFSWLLVVPSID